MMKVLWLEDEIDKIEAFLDRLYMVGISVTHKDTANNFIAELNTNLDDYDAVILDVMGVVNSLEEKSSSKAFSVAYNSVLSLKLKKNIPFFVLSAQLTKDENQGLKEYIGDAHIYIKSKDEERLIEDIKRAVVEQPDFILRNKYADVLSVFNENQIGIKHYDRIFNLIKWAESSHDIDGSEDQLTGIRKIIEAIFHALAKQGLVPSEITNSQGWLNGTSKFISNTHPAFSQVENYIHPTAALSLQRLLWIGQDGAHAEGDLKLRVDDYIQENQSGYLFKSCIYLLFDLIIWYKNLSRQYPDISENTQKYRLIDNGSNANIVDGILQQDNSNNYNCEGVLIPYKLITEFELKIGDQIRIINSADNNNDRNMELYKHYARTIEKI